MVELRRCSWKPSPAVELEMSRELTAAEMANHTDSALLLDLPDLCRLGGLRASGFLRIMLGKTFWGEGSMGGGVTQCRHAEQRNEGELRRT